MEMNRILDAVVRAAGLNARDYLRDDERRRAVRRLVEQAHVDPTALVAEVLKAQSQRDHARQCCDTAAKAATELEQLLKGMVEAHSMLCHLETVRETPAGPRAVCRLNGSLHEMAIHPDVDVGALRRLHSWDYVAVHEQVVVGMWADDERLYARAHGDVVEVKGYEDRKLHLVRVAHNAEEKVVMLDPTLWDRELAPRMRLVLQRDDPTRAIAVVPTRHVQSPFEMPVEKITTHLDDLAGLDDIAAKLIEDILLGVYFREIRDQFDLEPLKGVLLYSSRPGMGKTTLIRAIARWLYDHRDMLGADIVLYNVKPNESKSMWHGEDARIVREELFGAIRARQAMPRDRALVQLVVLDEIDSLGKRAGRGEPQLSSAQSDALEALLAEMDGIEQMADGDGPPAHLLVIGLTNRPDRLDEALKRPGRFTLVLSMPSLDADGAEAVMAVYADREPRLPWYLDQKVANGVDAEVIRSRFLRPAIARFFDAVVLRYKTDTQRAVEVTAGQILSSSHFMDAMNRAKKRASLRRLHGDGIPAITAEDIHDCLLDTCVDAARQMEADPEMLVRQLEIKTPVTTVEPVPRSQLQQHRYLRVSA